MAPKGIVLATVASIADLTTAFPTQLLMITSTIQYRVESSAGCLQGEGGVPNRPYMEVWSSIAAILLSHSVVGT